VLEGMKEKLFSGRIKKSRNAEKVRRGRKRGGGWALDGKSEGSERREFSSLKREGLERGGGEVGSGKGERAS